MHPIERLRFVARSEGAPADLLVSEAAMALGAFRDDPAGMVAACRRIVDRQLACGPLWWLCARILCASDPMAEARAAVDEMEADPTDRRLAAALPDDATVVVVGVPEVTLAALARRGDVRPLVVDVDGAADAVVRHLERLDVGAEAVAARSVAVAVDRADLVVIEASAAGPTAALVPSGARAAAAVAARSEVPVWLALGAGRLLPERMWDALVSRWSASVDPFDAAEEELDTTAVDRIAGPDGPVPTVEALRAVDCPVAPELFRLAG
ncbi:MAG: hypothetical protein JST64_08395 [Actinobacteria bacterium]|nr:hypothetical protein [Actinomycetota bacterium]